MPRFVIDCGSRSIKLHAASAGLVSPRSTCSWDPARDGGDRLRVAQLLDELARQLPAAATVHVVGTAAARRMPEVARTLGAVCAARGWRYRTISQRLEARLIRDAFPHRGDCDIVNAGGGSIQIVRPDGSLTLLEFGITELNARFGLTAAPSARRVAAAVAFVTERLPPLAGPFLYSGGELSYLQAAGALLDGDRCPYAEFRRVAARVDAMTRDELPTVSPFDPGWSSGAVASNAIVEACFARSGADFYFASDVNIGDGLIRRLAGNEPYPEPVVAAR